MGVRTNVSTVRAEIKKLGREADPLSQVALTLAARLDNAEGETGSALAAVAKELRVCLDTLGKSPVAAADPVDELRKRREAKRKGA